MILANNTVIKSYNPNITCNFPRGKFPELYLIPPQKKRRAPNHTTFLGVRKVHPRSIGWWISSPTGGWNHKIFGFLKPPPSLIATSLPLLKITMPKHPMYIHPRRNWISGTGSVTCRWKSLYVVSSEAESESCSTGGRWRRHPMKRYENRGPPPGRENMRFFFGRMIQDMIFFRFKVGECWILVELRGW